MAFWRVYMPRLKLTAIDEGYSVVVSSRLLGADDPELVQDAILKLFPDFTCGLPPKPKFPSEQDDIIASENVSMQTFLEAIHNQSILDTALDYMSANLDINGTVFHISRQLLWQVRSHFLYREIIHLEELLLLKSKVTISMIG